MPRGKARQAWNPRLVVGGGDRIDVPWRRGATHPAIRMLAKLVVATILLALGGLLLTLVPVEPIAAIGSLVLVAAGTVLVLGLLVAILLAIEGLGRPRAG